MSTRNDGRAELDATLAALDLVAAEVTAGREQFDGSTHRQRALVFLWANIGSQLKQYCRGLDIPKRLEPFAGPVQMRDRLVYSSVLTLDPTIVWDTSVHDGPKLRRIVADLRDGMRG